jgi:hypothetical protein
MSGSPREVFRQAIKIDQRGEENIVLFSALELVRDISAHDLISCRNAATVNLSMVLTVSDLDGVNPAIPLREEVRCKELSTKPLFRWSLAEDVEFSHGRGPPPITFFSQSSPML